MNEVKIYTVVSDELSPPVIGESFCTDMVRHSDYASIEQKLTDMTVQLANAESKCRELAGLVAENADLKSLIEQHACSIAVCPNCSHEEPSETDDIVALYRSLKTPATDAFQAEVRAQGVEMLVKHCEQKALEKSYDFFMDAGAVAAQFAAQLRQEAQ